MSATYGCLSGQRLPERRRRHHERVSDSSFRGGHQNSVRGIPRKSGNPHRVRRCGFFAIRRGSTPFVVIRYIWGYFLGYLRISRKVGPDPDWAALLAAQYRFAGKEKLLALGVYPEVSLQHRDRIWSRLETDIFRGWQSVQSTRSTHRKFSNACAVLRHEGQSKLRDGFDTPLPLGMAKNDPAEVLKGALTKCRTRPFPAIIDLEQVGALLRAIDGLHVSLVVQCAARLGPILFVRSGELRHAEWPEIDLDGAEWRNPAEKMKSRVVHIVPPPSQAAKHPS